MNYRQTTGDCVEARAEIQETCLPTGRRDFIRVDSSFVCSKNSHFFILQSAFGLREKQGELNPTP